MCQIIFKSTTKGFDFYGREIFYELLVSLFNRAYLTGQYAKKTLFIISISNVYAKKATQEKFLFVKSKSYSRYS